MNARELTAALRRAGLEPRRGKGSHLNLQHPVTGRKTVVPQHPGTMDPRLVRTILKQAGISDEEFLDLLR